MYLVSREAVRRSLTARLSIVAVVASGVSVIAAASGSPSAYADGIPGPTAPTSISLTADQPTFAAGESVTLTATTDQDVLLSLSTISIVDQTTNTTLKSCTSGTTCSVPTRFYTGGPHTYVAKVNALTSAPVEVSRQPWTVSLVADPGTFAAGQAVELTATANQSVAGTNGSYALYLFNATTGALYQACQPAGSTSSCSASRVPFYAGGPAEFIAAVAKADTALTQYSQLVDLQATSNRVELARQAWTVTLTANRSTFAAGQTVALEAVTNQSITATNGSYAIYVFNVSTGALWGSCQPGSTTTICTPAARVPFHAGGPNDYLAVVAKAASGIAHHSQVSDVQATSNTVTLSRQPWTVTLTADRTVFSAGQVVNLTATADQNVGSTNGQYVLAIVAVDTGADVRVCTTGTTCSTAVVFYSGPPRTYRGVLRRVGPPADIEATSNDVVLSRQAWAISLTTSTAVFPAGQNVTLTATANQDIGATNSTYAIYIANSTTGQIVTTCQSSGTQCVRTAVPFTSGGPFDYIALLAQRAAGVSTIAQLSDIQATSNVITLSRLGWDITLTTNLTTFRAGEPVTLTAAANQNVGATGSNYAIYLYDASAGRIVTACTSGTICAPSLIPFTTDGPREFRSVVAKWVSGLTEVSQLTDIQATSNTVTLSRAPWTITLSSDKTEFTTLQNFRLSAIADQNIRQTGGHFAVYLFDSTEPRQLTQCTPPWANTPSTGMSSTPCSADSKFFSGGPHTYVAVVAAVASTSTSFDQLTDVQAISNPVTVARAPWQISIRYHIAPSYPVIYYADRVCLTLAYSANQSTGSTNGSYVQAWIDNTTGQVLKTHTDNAWWDPNLTQCFPYAQPAVLVAVIARHDAQTNTVSDIQATSNGMFLPGDFVGPTLPGETVAGCNPSESTGHRCAADPVSTATGDFSLASTDLGIDGKGPALSVSRTYSGQRAPAAGPFGYGWADSFNTQLTFSGGTAADPRPGKVSVTQENGAQLVFLADPSFNYLAPSRVFARLEHHPATQRWTLTRRDREQFVFDAGGRLVELRDLAGNALTLTRDVTGRLISASAAGGRTLTFDWTGDRITTVTDSAGRTVSYGYDSAGDLRTFTAADGRVTSYVYDTAHRMTSFTRPGGGTTVNVYDTANRVTSQRDPLNRETRFGYAGSYPIVNTTTTHPGGSLTFSQYHHGRLVLETHGYGTTAAATWNYAYDSASNLTETTDPTGAKTRWTYDARGNRLTTVDALNKTTSYTYDALNNPKSVTDPAGNATAASYDAGGNRLSLTRAPGLTETWTYNPDGTTATWTGPAGQPTTYTYDAAGRVRTITGPDNRTTTLGYNTRGQLTTVTDPAGKTTTTTYDNTGRVLTVTDPAGHTTTSGYDAAGNHATTTDPAGDTSTDVYDLAGHLTSRTDANGHTTTFTYTARGELATVTDPNGHTTTHTYDARGNRLTSKDPLNRVTQFQYDGNGRLLATTTPGGRVLSAVYDPAGRVTKTVDGNGKETTRSYDTAGRLATTTDPLGRVTTMAYTPDGRPATVTWPDASTSIWDYDPAGRLRHFTDPDGQKTTYAYDPAGRTAALTRPGGLATTHTYDAAGRVHVTTRPDGSTATHTYDDAGQLTGIDHSDPVSTDVSFGYDPVGRRTTMTDATGTTTYTYDDAGQLTASTSAGTTVGYGYDDAGQLTTITYPGGNQVTYSYDNAGQLSTLTDWADRVTSYTWTANSEQATRTTPDGVTRTVARKPGGETTRIDLARGTDTLAAYTYDYDHAGQLTADTHPGGTSHAYTYTPLGQLDDVTTTAPEGQPNTAGYTVTSGGKLTGLPNGATLTYNPAGQLTTITPTQGPGTAFAYTANGQRTTATTPAGDLTPASTATYAYTPTGALRTATVNGATVDYTSDAAGLRRTRTTGTTTTHYTWAVHSSIPLLLEDGSHRYIYGPDLTPTAQVNKTTGTVEYLHGDAVGSVRAITDPVGTLVGTTTYDPYGNRTNHTGTADSAVGYTGNLTDPTTGLIYLRARDYDATTGQFLTLDPAVDLTRQPYSYADNNPLQNTDPTGLFSIRDAGFALLSAGAGALNGVTGGLSSVVLDRLAPGLSCQLKNNPFYTIGEFAALGIGGGALAIRLAQLSGKTLRPWAARHLDDLRGNTGHRAPSRGVSAGGGDDVVRDPIPGGRADGQTVFAGHGFETPLAGDTTIPQGTWLHVYSRPGGTISDAQGLKIEGGTWTVPPVRIFGPGDTAPNLILGPRGSLQTMTGSIQRGEDTLLSDLLKPNMGICHWAACTQALS